MGRLSYVCGTCSEHFTRKYSAMRHNFNIHNGGAEIVRLIDYIVGRVTGKYLATHPSWYRRERKSQTGSDHIYENKFRPTTVTDSSGDTFQPRDAWQQPPQAIMHYSSHYFTSPKSRPDDLRYGNVSPLTRIKLEELEGLLIKHQRYFNDVNEIFKWTLSFAIKGDDRPLDEKLAMLRNLDKQLKMNSGI
jgi:hypothetical protein